MLDNFSFIKIPWLHFVTVWAKYIVNIPWFSFLSSVPSGFFSPSPQIPLFKKLSVSWHGGSFPSKENVIAHNSEMLQIKTSPAGRLKKQRGAIEPCSLCWPFTVSMISHGVKFNLSQLGLLEENSQASGSDEEPGPKSAFYCPDLLL